MTKTTNATFPIETPTTATLDVVVDAASVDAAAVFAEGLAALVAVDEAPARLRLFRPLPAVALGRDQAVAREVRLDHCRAESIPVLRRPTGGGALWLDPDQLALALVIDRARLGPDPAARLATGAGLLADALARLGLPTDFVVPNDLQVTGGAKIASVFLAEGGGGDREARAFLFATLLIDFDVRAALTALLVPTEKLTVTGLEHARERVATLRSRLDPCPSDEAIAAAVAAAVAEGLGLAAIPRGPAPLAPMPGADLAHAPDPWSEPLEKGFETTDKTARATLRLRLALADDGETVAAARLATDAAFVPDGLVARIETGLVGTEVARLPVRMRDLADEVVGFPGADLVRLAARAFQKHRLARVAGLDSAQTSGLMLAGPGSDAADALVRASVMLVPYCAKPAWCALRPTPDCIECGHCEVGDAYRLARERGLDVTTITNFEHLSETLAEMRARGVTSYVGMCCSDFFLKRHAAFREAGMDAVLMDIVGATCYELKEEHLAYAGVFRAEAALDLDALEKIAAHVPVHSASPPAEDPS